MVADVQDPALPHTGFVDLNNLFHLSNLPSLGQEIVNEYLLYMRFMPVPWDTTMKKKKRLSFLCPKLTI